MERFSKLYKNEWEKIVAEQKKAGCTVIEGSAKDVDRFANLPAWDKLRSDWVTNATKAGVKDAQGLLETMSSIIDEEIQKETKK